MVDLGFNILVELYLSLLKNGIHSFFAWRSAFRGGCGEQASKFACVPGQGTLRDASTLCVRQVARPGGMGSARRLSQRFAV